MVFGKYIHSYKCYQKYRSSKEAYRKNLLVMTLITQFEMLICPGFNFDDVPRRHQMIFNHYKAL